ncbi:ankyrin repeat-containing domain protein [Penicillium manginii]|uniref:ankyrin repeat-containing domain protein n=1 Tax=Penicillium manginii TaxID=203109 RepID=UPI0025478681|nr:ankyrin repeat-containing domain protein [Penicillium manginii]KAJ5733025.1 ankyrin repeat-containing domain protein [Penicillium manginii]
MFLLSNKLPIHVQIKSLDRRKWLAEEDIRIMRLVEVLELSNGFIFQHLLSTTQSSAQAILERIFQSAIRLQDFKIIEIMLQAGISPDLPIVSCESGKELLVSPLEVAASIENRSVSLRLTRLLLSFQANIHQFKSKPALQICIEMMGDYSNPNRELPTELSAERENLELLRLLLKSNPDLETRFRGFGARGPKVTALGLAVTLGQLQAVKVLIEHRANIYAAQQTYLDSDYPKFKTDLLGLASKRGDMAMMRMLFDISSNQRSQTTLCYKLIESLILAVTFSHEEATKLLLTAGVAVQAADNFLMARDASHKTLVERALAQQSRRLHLTLLSAGAVPVDRQAVIDSYSFDLLRSIKANDVRVVTDMLSWGAPPDDVYDDFPDSALGAAIAQGSCELIKLLKIAGATAEDLRIPCIPDMETVCCLTEIGFLPTILINSGQMILTCAILKAKDDKLINHLLSCGVDQQEMRLGFPESFEYWLDNLGLPECRTPLEAALSRRNMALAQVLIRRGARVSENELNAIVWQAVITDDEIIVPQFLAMFSTPFQAPTAMGMAVLWGRRDIFLALLEFGIDPKGYVFITDPPDEDEEVTSHNSGWWHLEPEGIMSSVLQVAASKGDRCTLQLFLNSANWSEEDKGRALTASIFWRNYHIVSDLSEAGASVNQGILETFALSDRYVQHMRYSQEPFEFQANISYRVNTEMLPLQLAVNANNIDMVKYLLAMGAKINQLEAGVGGKTPLQVAAKNGNAELLTLLLDHGADVNHPPATNMGATALQFAASEGQIEIVCHLLDIGADVNAPRSQIFGRTAMEGAAERGHLDILQLIINNGAQTDGLGRGQLIRSVKLAENNGHFATARLLKSTCGWSEADKARCSLERFDEQEHLR